MRMDRKIRARINITTAGDNTIIAAPTGAGQYLEIDHIDFLASGGANTVTLKEGASTTISDYDLLAAQGYNLDFNNIDRNKIVLPVNTAFILNLSAATKVQGLVLAQVGGE